MVGTAGIRTYDFYRVKVQRKGPNEQSKGAEQLHPGYSCTLDIGIVMFVRWS